MIQPQLTRYGAAMSLEEIAKEMNMSVGAVHTCLYRALLKLRSHGLVDDMLELAAALDKGRRELR